MEKDKIQSNDKIKLIEEISGSKLFLYQKMILKALNKGLKIETRLNKII